MKKLGLWEEKQSPPDCTSNPSLGQTILTDLTPVDQTIKVRKKIEYTSLRKEMISIGRCQYISIIASMKVRVDALRMRAATKSEAIATG